MYTPPLANIFFVEGYKFSSCLVARGRENCKSLGTFCIGGTNFEIFSLRIFSLFKCPLKLSKQCLLLFGNNSVKVWILFDMSSE